MDARTGRHCHDVLNPLHSLVYFAPEADPEYVGAGLARGRMGYFASRAAPMGAVTAATIRATFFNFAPALIARHIPAAWELATPGDVYAARLRVVDRAMRRVLGDDVVASPRVREAAELALAAGEAGRPDGRPLYAAHAAQVAPDLVDAPHVALWFGATLIREYRGDGHIVALVEAELDGVEALFTHTATGRGFTAEFAVASRGWTGEEWAAAAERLAERGLVDGDGALTERGFDLRRTIEARTDRLGVAPFEHLGDEGTARLTELGRYLTGVALTNGAFPTGVFATPKG